MASERYLDEIEVRSLNNANSFAVEYAGKIDENALRKAFDLLCQRYPVLRARVRWDGKGYLIYLPEESRPSFVVVDGDEHAMQLEITRRWDPAEGLVKLILVRSLGQGFVTLRMDHSIVDASGWTTMLGDLWRWYTDIVSETDFTVDRGMSLPVPPSQLFRDRWGRMDEVSDGTSARVPERAGIVQRHEALSEADTDRLVCFARNNGTSVNALVCGAILVAQRSVAASGPQAVPMACLVPVDFRNRVDPPVGATETTNFLRGYRADVLVPGAGEPLAVGDDVKKKLDAAISAEEGCPTDLSGFYSAQAESSLEPRWSAAFISNVGVIRDYASPVELSITDFRMIADSTTGISPRYGLYTYGGCLHILCFAPSALFTVEEVDEVVARSAKMLTRNI